MSFSILPHGESEGVKQFTLSTPQQSLDDMKTLLKLSRIAEPTFENTQKDQKYGVSRDWIQDIKTRWIDFDWTKTEAKLNSLPNFKALVRDVDGKIHDIHFAALFSEKADAIPLLMLHGWPGSFLEFVPILQALKQKYVPSNLPYHVVVPSLPGYTLSSGPPLDRNFGYDDAARVLDCLMVDYLGFKDGYIAQGGDIGSHIARCLGGQAFECCKAIHLNFLMVPPFPPPGKSTDDLTAEEKEGIARGMDFHAFGAAYALQHATRPSTIGLALASNPIALMAWVGEKLLGWTDEDLPAQTVIEMVTLYWLTNSIERCIYPYRQGFPTGAGKLTEYLSDKEPSTNPVKGDKRPGFIEKPVGFSSFPKELSVPPRSWVEAKVNLVWYRRHDRGGHFAALERPEDLLEDVEEFIKTVWE